MSNQARQVSFLSIDRQLKKMSVTLFETGRRIGQAVDAVIHPTGGMILGLIVQTDDRLLRAVAAADFFIFNQPSVVVISEEALFDPFRSAEKLAGGLSVCRDIVGSGLVTDQGQYLGDVREVLMVEGRLRPVYRIAESIWQKAVGGGFYIPAELPYAWSRESACFLVRTEELMRRRASHPIEAFESSETEPVLAP
ncbi:MAG TPA: hypothetical protein VJ302_34130 [Blastocatellia bacterium]|nr:hypothetical protein [Blastocatellia bacterium]